MIIIANYNLLFKLLGATFFVPMYTSMCLQMHAFAIQLVINSKRLFFCMFRYAARLLVMLPREFVSYALHFYSEINAID